MSEKIIDPRLQMAFYGDLSVLSTLKNQAVEPKSDTNLVVVMPGGGQQGIFLAGVAETIHKLNLTSGINDIVSNSSGAAVGYFLVAGQANAADIFHTRNPENLVRFPRNPILDIKTLALMVRDEYPIDVKAFLASNTRLHVGLTHWETGQEVMLNTREIPNHPLLLVAGSMCVPYLAGLPSPTVLIGGRRYADGLTNPLPINRALELNPTDLLVIAPNPIDHRIPENRIILETIERLVRRRALPGIARSLATFPEHFNSSYDELVSYIDGRNQIPGVRIAVIAPTIFTNPLCMDRKELWVGQNNARLFAHRLLRPV